MPLLTTHHSLLTDFLPFAHKLADAAGAVIRPYFGAHGDVDEKVDDSPVTRADREAEAAMRALIEREFPDHAIYGEELGTTHHSPLTTHYTWVLDPIDGTRAFIAGRKEWGTLIALCENSVPILGILDQPITGERWVGVKGGKTVYFRHSNESWTRSEAERGVVNPSSMIQKVDSSLRWNDGAAINTRPCSTLASASISSTYCAPPDDARYAALAKQCREQITAGDCYAYGLLAKGERDIVCDTALKPYDILALVPIIEGAGGHITTWDGAPVTLTNYKDVVAVGDGVLGSATTKILNYRE